MVLAYELVSHVLNHLFHGNKSAFARELKTDAKSVRRALDRLKAGKSSPSILFRSMAFYDKHPELLDSFVMEHVQSAEAPHKECQFINVAREAVTLLQINHSVYSAQARRVHQLAEASQEIVPVLAAALCGQNKNHCIACREYKPEREDGRVSGNLPDTLPCEAFRRFMACTKQAILLHSDKHSVD